VSARSQLVLFVVLVALGAHAQSQEILFAEVAHARNILSTSDAYSKTMTTFDRAARLKTDRDTTEADFLAFAAGAALDWSPDEREAVESALRDVMPVVKRLALPLPGRIYMIKTSGAEDAQAAYTRQNAIILPTRLLALRDTALRRLVAHELFHVSTRAHPKLADRLYAVIGFQRCAVDLPDAIKARRITNPDAPKDEHCIRISVGQEKTRALPVLLSTASREDFARGAVFLNNVVVALLLVDTPDGKVRLVRPEEAAGFFEQIGQNTRYILHPEEIVADNFALLAIEARDVPSPRILAAVEQVIAQYAAALAPAVR
jgi:hypothetical protein